MFLDHTQRRTTHFLQAVANYRLDGKPDFEQLRVCKAYVHALKHEIKLLQNTNTKIHMLPHSKQTASKRPVRKR